MATASAEINPLLIAVITGHDMNALPEKPSPSMLPGKYGSQVYKHRKKIEPLHQPNKQTLICRNCGKKATYDVGTIVLNHEKYTAAKDNTKSGTVKSIDGVQTTGYFRCKQCNGAGEWEVTSNFFMTLTVSLLMATARQRSSKFSFGEIALYDGYQPQWATDGEQHLLMKLKNQGQDAYIWNRLGNLYNMGGRPELATVAFEQSIHVDPSQVESHFTHGMILKEIGAMEQAAFHFSQMLMHASEYKALKRAELRKMLAVGLQHLFHIHIDSPGIVPFIPLKHDIKTIDLDPYDVKSFYPLAEIYMGKQQKNKSKR